MNCQIQHASTRFSSHFLGKCPYSNQNIWFTMVIIVNQSDPSISIRHFLYGIFPHGGFHKWGIPNSWMVSFMENPWKSLSKIKMITGGTPMTQETTTPFHIFGKKKHSFPHLCSIVPCFFHMFAAFVHSFFHRFASGVHSFAPFFKSFPHVC